MARIKVPLPQYGVEEAWDELTDGSEARVVSVVGVDGNPVMGATADAPADVVEDTTARSGISLLKGIKNYLRLIQASVAGTLTTLMTRGTTTVAVTIANGQSLSGEVDLAGYSIVAIQMPAAWTAANLTFQGATSSGGTFQDLYDDSGQEAVAIAAVSRMIGVDALAGVMAAVRFIKVRSGTTGTPVAQGADRAITFVLKA